MSPDFLVPIVGLIESLFQTGYGVRIIDTALRFVTVLIKD